MGRKDWHTTFFGTHLIEVDLGPVNSIIMIDGEKVCKKANVTLMLSHYKTVLDGQKIEIYVSKTRYSLTYHAWLKTGFFSQHRF